MVKAQRVNASDTELLDPESQVWDGVRTSELSLNPTPVASQPSKYVQEKWKDTPYGTGRTVTVRAAHNGERMYFHLSFSDETEDSSISDTDRFADAAAVLFPVNGDAPLQSMGSSQLPVNAWYWRPDFEGPWSITAQGTGTTRRTQDPELGAVGKYGRGAWQLVIRRRLDTALAEYVRLVPGTVGKVGFALWQGSNQERGGLKAVTLDWEQLEIEA